MRCSGVVSPFTSHVARRAALLVVVAALAVAPAAAGAQTLYAVSRSDGGGTRGPLELQTVERTSCASLSTIGALSLPGDTLFDLRGMAMDPVTGGMYVIAFGGSGNSVCTLDLSTAALTVVSAHGTTEWLRDLAFDASGQLYAVSGNDGTHPNSLLTVNTTTGALTLKTALTGASAHAIAFNPETPGVLYHRYGTTGLETVDIASNALVQIGASPAADSPEYGMVWDPVSDVFRSCDSSGFKTWSTLTAAGARADTGFDCADEVFGLAFDQETTVPVELQGFSVE